MKNRIEEKFKFLKAKGQKALIAFVTAGDPNLKLTPKIVDSLEVAGVDIIELGMPFSDPMADGIVIQRSSERALRSGTNLKGIFQTVKKIRQKSSVPILLMGYFNPVLHYGIKDFFQHASQAGVDGVLLVDLPPEEGEEVRKIARQHHISLIYLLAPTSNIERIKLVRKKGSGFIYYVSLTGVTGAALAQDNRSFKTLKQVFKDSPLPVCVGFGIKTSEQVSKMKSLADGVVVGSAFVELFEKYPSETAIAKMTHLAKKMSNILHA